MAGDIKLKADTSISIVSGGGAIASGASSAQLAGTGFDNGNSGNCYEYVTAKLSVTSFSGSTPAAGDTIGLYLVPHGASFDTSGPYGPSNYLVGLFQVPLAVSTAQIMAIDLIPLSAISYDIYLINNSVGSIVDFSLDLLPTKHQYT